LRALAKSAKFQSPHDLQTAQSKADETHRRFKLQVEPKCRAALRLHTTKIAPAIERVDKANTQSEEVEAFSVQKSSGLGLTAQPLFRLQLSGLSSFQLIIADSERKAYLIMRYEAEGDRTFKRKC